MDSKVNFVMEPVNAFDMHNYIRHTTDETKKDDYLVVDDILESKYLFLWQVLLESLSMGKKECEEKR